MKSALVLCSGGLDSVTTAHYVKKKLGYGEIKILFFDYGQRTLEAERKCAKACARELNGELIELKISELSKISGSLINSSEKPGKLGSLKNTKKESEKYYVPCRNIIFLSYALSIAESLYIKGEKVYDIFVGFKNEGEEHYPDTTEKFVKQMCLLSEMTCKKPFEIRGPLIKKDKEDIVLLGKSLEVDFKKTYSCYVQEGKHCGTCLACKLRQAGFKWAGVEDVTEYTKL